MNLRPRKKEPPRVDLTPLIDVVFLMLIFFMVSTTFDRQTQLKVDLPSAETLEQENKKPESISIVIDQQGKFYVNDQELIQQNAKTLRRSLQKISEGDKELPILVSGDRQAPLQSIPTTAPSA